MDLRKSSKFKGLLTKRSSVDSTSTIKSDKEETPKRNSNKKKSKLPITRLDYGDDDALIESGLWSDIKVMLWDFIPDYTPLNFILMHLFTYMIFLSFRAVTFPSPKDPMKVDEEIQVQYEHLSYIKDYFDSDEKQYDLIINTIKLVFLLLLINLFFLFIVLLIRFIFMKFLFEPFSRISRSAVLIAYSVDPSVFYFLWSLINYTVFLRCTVDGNFYLIMNFLGGNNGNYLVYEFKLLGYYFSKDFWIDSKCYSWSKSMYHLHILFGVRKLILSSILFLFELQFLANYSTDLTTYLNELSCLRKFTLKWLNYVYYRKSLRSKQLDALMLKFLNTDMSIVKKSYNTIWMQHCKDDFKIFRPILSKWQHHNIKNDLDLNDYNGTDFLKDLWINSMSIKPSVNWIVLNYVIHNPPEILLLHNSIQLICRETIDYCSKLLFDQIYETLTLLKTKGASRMVSFNTLPLKIKDEEKKENEYYTEDETDDFYRFENVGDKAYRLSQLAQVRHVDELNITRDFEPERARKYRNYNDNKFPEFMKYRTTILDPNTPIDKCMNALISNKMVRDIDKKDQEEKEDNRYITRELCCDLDQSIVEDFFISCDISNCGAISRENFMTTVINMCSIRKKLITTLKNQRSILELVGNLISIILWFMSFVALLLSFRINKNIVLPSTIGLFSATIVALSYMYTSFITAIMFVVISNPYNVGDRVRIDGQVMYVRRITTYNTEFRSSHGKHIIYQNILLSKMLIVNESRAKHATLELSLKMSSSTTPAALKMLRDNVKTFVNGRPRDFVTNSIFFHCNELQVGHHINLVIWATCVETWSNTLAVFGIKTELMRFVANQCKLLGINYERPLSPIYFKNSLSLGGLDNYISNYMSSYHDVDNKHKKDKKSGLDKDNKSIPRKSEVSTKSAGSEGTIFSFEPPISLKTVFKTARFEQQKSIGPLSIEPMFPGLRGSRGKIHDSRAPPVPPIGTLKYVKNIPVVPQPIHHIPKRSDVDNYENVWLNTWSPENRPNRLKTFSFDSDLAKSSACGSTEGKSQADTSSNIGLSIVNSKEFNIESPLRPISTDFDTKDLDKDKDNNINNDNKENDKLDENKPLRKSKSKRSIDSNSVKTSRSSKDNKEIVYKDIDKDNKNNTNKENQEDNENNKQNKPRDSKEKRKSSSVRSNSEGRINSDDNTDQAIRRKTKPRSSSEHRHSVSRKSRISKDTDESLSLDTNSFSKDSKFNEQSIKFDKESRTSELIRKKSDSDKDDKTKERKYRRDSKDLVGSRNNDVNKTSDKEREKSSERKRSNNDKKNRDQSVDKKSEKHN